MWVKGLWSKKKIKMQSHKVSRPHNTCSYRSLPFGAAERSITTEKGKEIMKKKVNCQEPEFKSDMKRKRL